MPKEIWDLKAKPLCIANAKAMQQALAQSSFTHVDIHNISPDDLTRIITVLDFYNRLDGILVDIRKSIDDLGKKKP